MNFELVLMLLLSCVLLSMMMAGKNPKRVAAGKKAWRSRRASGSKRRYTRNKRYRRKPIQRGITGRVGAFVLGVIPVAIGGSETIATTLFVRKRNNLDGFSTFFWGLLRFTNNMSAGFVGIVPFEDTYVNTPQGGRTKIGVGSGVPKGSLWIPAVTGTIMMGYDWIASKLAGGRPVKIPMTNYNATGGS